MIDPVELPRKDKKITIPENIDFLTTRAQLEINEWENPDDISVLVESLIKSEELLNIETTYKIRLFNKRVSVTNKDQVLATVEDGALITTSDGNATIILTGNSLSIPSKYAIYEKSNENPLIEVETTREEEIIITVAEEMYHLYDHLNGNIPDGTIDTVTEYKGKYDQKHEKDAALFRIKLLSALRNKKWDKFQKIIDSKDSYSEKLRLHWGKTKPQE